MSRWKGRRTPLLIGFTWLESSFDDAGATEGGLEALVAGFSLDGLFVTEFALQPEAGQPGDELA